MAKEVIFEGRKIRVTLTDVELPDGRTAKKEIVEHPGAVVILPLFDDEKVLLEDHYRPAVGGNLIEAVAGTLDAGESPLECAHRELAEEMGLRAGRMTELGTFYSSPGVLTEVMHTYLAEGLAAGERRLEADEFLEPIEVDLDEAIGWAVSGEIRDAKTIAILFLAKEHLKSMQGFES